MSDAQGRAGREFRTMLPANVRFLGVRTCSACRSAFITEAPAQRRCHACMTGPVEGRRAIIRAKLGLA